MQNIHHKVVLRSLQHRLLIFYSYLTIDRLYYQNPSSIIWVDITQLYEFVGKKDTPE
jgi:hypothetical protein